MSPSRPEPNNILSTVDTWKRTAYTEHTVHTNRRKHKHTQREWLKIQIHNIWNEALTGQGSPRTDNGPTQRV